MFCGKCGKQSEGTDYCPNCGAEMYKTEQKMTAPAAPTAPVAPIVPAESTAPDAPRARSTGRVWAIIGIAAGVVIIAAAALFFLLTHTVEGQWYNEERGEVLTLSSDGTAELTSFIHADNTDYKYDRLSGQGSFKQGDVLYEFTSDSAQIDVKDLGTYIKAGSDFNADKFFEEYGSLGTWYSEERGEVLAFNTDGTMKSIHMSSANDAAYEYDRESGTGTITLGALSFAMQYSGGKLNVTDMGEFAKAAEGFDSDSFIGEHGDSVLGLWFDPEGEYSCNLFADGTCSIVSYGTEKESVYTVNGTSVSISFYSFDTPIPLEYTLKDGQLLLGGATESILVRDYIEQKGADRIYDEIIGKYIDGNDDNITLEFFEDGTALLDFYDVETRFNVKYDPIAAYGFLEAQEENSLFSDLQFLRQDGDLLMLGQESFYKQ